MLVLSLRMLFRIKLLSDADQDGHGTHLHLLHHPSAMNLGGFFHDTQIVRDLLVQPAPRDPLENLKLTRSEAVDERSGGPFVGRTRLELMSSFLRFSRSP